MLAREDTIFLSKLAAKALIRKYLKGSPRTIYDLLSSIDQVLLDDVERASIGLIKGVPRKQASQETLFKLAVFIEKLFPIHSVGRTTRQSLVQYTRIQEKEVLIRAIDRIIAKLWQPNEPLALVLRNILEHAKAIVTDSYHLLSMKDACNLEMAAVKELTAALRYKRWLPRAGQVLQFIASVPLSNLASHKGTSLASLEVNHTFQEFLNFMLLQHAACSVLDATGGVALAIYSLKNSKLNTAKLREFILSGLNQELMRYIGKLFESSDWPNQSKEKRIAIYKNLYHSLLGNNEHKSLFEKWLRNALLNLVPLVGKQLTRQTLAPSLAVIAQLIAVVTTLLAGNYDRETASTNATGSLLRPVQLLYRYLAPKIGWRQYGTGHSEFYSLDYLIISPFIIQSLELLLYHYVAKGLSFIGQAYVEYKLRQQLEALDRSGELVLLIRNRIDEILLTTLCNQSEREEAIASLAVPEILEPEPEAENKPVESAATSSSGFFTRTATSAVNGLTSAVKFVANQAVIGSVEMAQEVAKQKIEEHVSRVLPVSHVLSRPKPLGFCQRVVGGTSDWAMSKTCSAVSVANQALDAVVSWRLAHAKNVSARLLRK